MRLLYRQNLQINEHQTHTDMKLLFHQKEIYALFEELIHKPWGYETWQPSIDIFEQKDSFSIKVDLPGVNAEEISVSVSDTRLLIEGRRTYEENLEDEKLLVCECPRGIFFREIEFFEELSTLDVKTKNENGVLTIVVKKQNSKS
jgi:HSP20 family molecular chaperone IbpA